MVSYDGNSCTPGSYGFECEYRRDLCSGSTLGQEDRLYHPIFDAMERCVRGLAKADSQAFLTFARASLGYDGMVVQRLLCRGFWEISTLHLMIAWRF